MSATGKRRKSRELAMQMLFQADVGKHTPDQVRKTFWGSREEVDAETRGFSEDIFRVATARNEEIDELIQAHSANWRLSRMPAVDRNVLRTAIAELLGFPDTPVPVVINESLEIARRYSAPESLTFLNGVLDAIARQRKSSAVSSSGQQKKTSSPKGTRISALNYPLLSELNPAPESAFLCASSKRKHRDIAGTARGGHPP